MEGRSRSNQQLYTKVRHFSQKDQNRIETPTQYRAAIKSVVEQLKLKHNTKEFKELLRLIDRWQQSNDRSGTAEEDRLYHLRLLDVEKLLQHLDRQFLKLLEDLPDRRLQDIYSQYRHILYRISKLQATSMHVHSTQMKRHLLDEFKEEQQRRKKAQKERNLLLEGTQQALLQKDRIINDLKSGYNNNEGVLKEKDRTIKELRTQVQGLYDKLRAKDQNSQQFKDIILPLKEQVGQLRRENQQLKKQNNQLHGQTNEIHKQNEHLKGELSPLYTRIEFLNKDIAEKDQNVQDCLKTIQSLKKSLDEVRAEVEACKTPINSQQKILQGNQTDRIYTSPRGTSSAFGQPRKSNLANTTPSTLTHPTPNKQKNLYPPAPPKNSRSLSAFDDGSDLPDSKIIPVNELIRMLFVQAISLEDFIKN